MLLIAKVLKSNGTDGGLLVSAPQVELSEIQGPVFIEFDGLPVPFFISDVRAHGTTKYVIHINDVTTLSDAEEMVGRAIYLDSEEEMDEEDGLMDFSGWTLFDLTGKGRKKVGVVSDYEPIPGNLCLYVETADGEEVMIPLHEDFIAEADPEKQELLLDLPEGLY